jgi:hypothetical protein
MKPIEILEHFCNRQAYPFEARQLLCKCRYYHQVCLCCYEGRAQKHDLSLEMEMTDTLTGNTVGLATKDIMSFLEFMGGGGEENRCAGLVTRKMLRDSSFLALSGVTGDGSHKSAAQIHK